MAARSTDHGPETSPRAARVLYEFGPFVLRVSDRTLFRGEERVRITPRVLDLLLCLVEEAGRVVTKERLLERVWEGTFVEEGNVNRTVSTLRRLLDETDSDAFVETVPRVGYRFVAAVSRRVEPSSPDAAPTDEPAVPAVAIPAGGAEARDEPAPAVVEAGLPPEKAMAAAGRRHSWKAALVVLAALAVLATAGVALWRARPPQAPRSLAVLPFRFGSGAANGETVGVALADAVIARLTRTRRIVVRPTTAVLPFRARTQDVREVARVLEVDSVLEATVTQERGRTRVALELVRGRDGSVLHAESFETGASGLFELQERVAERAAAALLVPLAPAEGRRAAARLAATDLCVRGRQLVDDRPMVTAAPDEAVSLFRRAIEADPDFALAYVGLADALLAASPDGADEAEEAAKRALAIDDRLGPAHATLAAVRMLRDWSWAAAEKELDRAIELEPSYAPAWQRRAILLALTGRTGGAKTAARHAVELDPTSPSVLCDAGRVALHAGAFDEARSLLGRARAASPGSARTALVGERVAEASDPATASRRAAETLASQGIGPESEVAPRVGTGDEAEVARALALAGHREAALGWLSEAVRRHRPGAPLAAFEPAFRPFRSDPRFAALVVAMGLPAPPG